MNLWDIGFAVLLLILVSGLYDELKGANAFLTGMSLNIIELQKSNGELKERLEAVEAACEPTVSPEAPGPLR